MESAVCSSSLRAQGRARPSRIDKGSKKPADVFRRKVKFAMREERRLPSEDAAQPTPRELLCKVLVAASGNFLEWYDFAIFGIFAAEIGAAFFPTGDGVSERQRGKASDKEGDLMEVTF